MCGIVGIYNHNKAAEMTALALFAEQHRGQESCGMAVTDGQTFRLRKKMGLVKDVFKPEKIAKLPGKIAIGHVRYPTRGTSTEYNSQPHVVETLAGPCYALASNGDLINYDAIKKMLQNKGVFFNSYNDGELILKHIAYMVEKEGLKIADAISSMMHTIKGAYSTVLATKNELYMFRDPYAIRPMVFGTAEDGTVAVASESCALDILGIKKYRELEAAEIIIVNEDGIESIKNNPDSFRTLKTDKHCIFEHIYFSRPDSFNFGSSVFSIREKIGAALADMDTDTFDAVIPVPDSSNFIALGYAKRRKIPFEMGLIRNHYVGRTFIKPEQTIRDESVKQKFNTLPNFFKGKKIVLVDDSIVRGTTIRKIVGLIKQAGASEVHLRIGSPSVKFSCFYGIDTPTSEELIANKMTVEEIKNYVEADSLKYLTIDGLENAVDDPQNYCNACFTGNYPLES